VLKVCYTTLVVLKPDPALGKMNSH